MPTDGDGSRWFWKDFVIYFHGCIARFQLKYVEAIAEFLRAVNHMDEWGSTMHP